MVNPIKTITPLPKRQAIDDLAKFIKASEQADPNQLPGREDGDDMRTALMAVGIPISPAILEELAHFTEKLPEPHKAYPLLGLAVYRHFKCLPLEEDDLQAKPLRTMLVQVSQITSWIS